MKLEQITVALRRRSPWEALDLGAAMLRAWRGPLLRAWLATYLPAALLLYLMLEPHWAALVLWWLKPAFDRVLLYVCGRAAFGAAPGVPQVFRELPRLLGRTGLLAALTVRRFSLERSFLLPVAQLEGLRGKAARDRRKVLAARTGSHAAWLTLVLAGMSAVLGFSILVVAQWLSPVDTPSLFDWELWLRDEAGLGMAMLINAAFMTADTVVEPLYVACGFGLYLNRRTELEGWDIELAFRRMSDRLGPQPVAAVLAVLLAGGVLLGPGTPWAAAGAGPGTVSAASPARQAVDAVLADPVFGRDIPDTEWRYRASGERREDPELPPWVAWLERLAESLAAGMRLLVHASMAVAVGVALFLLYRRRVALAAAARVRGVPPETLFGLDLRADALPADVAAAARAELAAGRHVAALSLLYRGALVALILRDGVAFRPGDTEDDCEARVRGRTDAAALVFFRDLLAAWRSAAYGHLLPDSPRLEALCGSWECHFGVRRAGAERMP